MKIRILNWLVSYLWNSISTDHLLKVDQKGIVYINGKRSNLDLGTLQDQARDMEKMVLWRLLIADAESQATERIITKSKTQDDILFGKAMLISVATLKGKIAKLAHSVPPKPNES